MIPNDALINPVRSQGFRFKRQTERVDVYKQRGGTQRVAIRRNRLHDESYARVVLRQTGMPSDDIEHFITNARRSH